MPSISTTPIRVESRPCGMSVSARQAFHADRRSRDAGHRATEPPSLERRRLLGLGAARSSWDLRVNQAREQLRRLHHALRGVRHVVLVQSLDPLCAYRFQLRHLPPRLQRIAREAALWSMDEIENDVGIGREEILLPELRVAAFNR